MINFEYDGDFDRLVEGLTEYGRFEATLRAVGDFSDGAEYKLIDPKHVLSLAEHYENNVHGYYNSLVLDLYSKASSMYRSLGDGETADMFLGRCEGLEENIKKSLRDLRPKAALDGICVVNQTLHKDEDLDWAVSVRDHADGLMLGLKNHDKIHREWTAISEVYFRLRHECNFPIKYIEKTIDGIVSDDLSVSDMAVEDIKKQANQCRLDGIAPIMQITSTGALEDAIRAFEEIGAFREASAMAGDLLDDDEADLQSKYRELANYLSLPALKSAQNV